MKYRIISIAALLALSACAPRVISVTDDSVTLRHDPSLVKFEAVTARADEYCATSGRRAVHVLTDPESKAFIQYSSFRCE